MVGFGLWRVDFLRGMKFRRRKKGGEERWWLRGETYDVETGCEVCVRVVGADEWCCHCVLLFLAFGDFDRA